MRSIPFRIHGMINGAVAGALIGFFFITRTDSRVSDVLLSLFSSLIFASIGYFWPERFFKSKKVDTSQSDRVERRRIQFSLARLLLATAMVAFVFGVMRYWFDYRMPMEIVAASMIAFAFGGLVLVAAKRDIKELVFIAFVLIFLVIANVLVVYFAHSTASPTASL
jgi:hypothetical protein